MVANNCKQFLHTWIAFTRFTQHFNTIIYKSQPGLWRHKLVSRISPKYTNSRLPSVHLGLWELQKFLADLLRGQAARHHVLACTHPHPTNVTPPNILGWFLLVTPNSQVWIISWLTYGESLGTLLWEMRSLSFPTHGFWDHDTGVDSSAPAPPVPVSPCRVSQ